jgi:hypothetical protein
MRPLALLAGLVVPCVLVAQGAADEPGISGYVLAPGDVPVSGGTVASVSLASNSSTAIDRSGRFRIPVERVERAGVLRVTVNVPGLTPYHFSVTVPASRTLRLPAIHLEPATYFRVRFVSPAGEPITSPVIRRLSFDGSGGPILEAPNSNTIGLDTDGATRIGPLPHGVTALALDTPPFAQTRLPNVSITGGEPLLDGGTIVVQAGSTLQVDVLDASGMPVPGHEVLLDDLLPLSPLRFLPVRTNAKGRASFERLAAGRYRVRTAAIGRCVTQELSLARTVTVPAAGTVNTRIYVSGQATFRVSSPTGPATRVVVAAQPDNPPSASPALVMGRGVAFLIATSLTSSRCRGTTGADGRVTLTSFPPGPSDIAVHFANSLYVRRLDVPIGGREIAVSVPDGILPVRVVNASTHEPVPQAFVKWTIEGGGRSEAVATILGDAMLEGVGTKAGILSVTAPGFQSVEERLPEPPGVTHDVALVPLSETRLRVRVVTASGEGVPSAVVELTPQNPLLGRQLDVTDRTGFVRFPDAPPGNVRLTAFANGYVASTLRTPEDYRADAVLTLSPGYRALVDVHLPAISGQLIVRVLNGGGQTMDALLDGASDRGIEPPGRLSLGPLPPGDYVIELRSAREQRQEKIRLEGRDVVVTVR